MPIIDLQRRLREIGRIRIGEQVPTSNGKTRPSKLDRFRLTSRDEHLIVAAADRFGGTPQPWTAPDGPQHELYTDTNVLPVVIPPTEMAFSQWYEQWSAGGCKVRCDGGWDQVGEKACHCDPDNRACAIHTRLSVMLPDLPGLGVWRLDTSGYYAAVELNGAVEVCQQFAGRGQMLPARLRLEQRRVLRTGRDGKAETRRFAVPVLDIDVQVGQLVAFGRPAGGGELPAPSFTPVAAIAPPSIDEQFNAVDTPAPQPPRSNARAPLPATGLAPRPAAEVAGPTCSACRGPLAGTGKVVIVEGEKRHETCPAQPVAAAPVEPLPLDDPAEDWERQKRRFHAIAGKRWPGDTKERETARHAWLADHCGVDSLKALDARQLSAAADALEVEVTDATQPSEPENLPIDEEPF